MNTYLNLRDYRNLHEEITAVVNGCDRDDLVPDAILTSLLQQYQPTEHDVDLSDTRSKDVGTNFRQVIRSGGSFDEVVAAFVGYYKSLGELQDDSELINAFGDVSVEYLELILPAMPDLQIDLFTPDTPLRNRILEAFALALSKSRWDLVKYMITKFDVSPTALYQVLQQNSHTAAIFAPEELQKHFPHIVDPIFFKKAFLLFVQQAEPAAIMTSIRTSPIYSLDEYDMALIKCRLNSEQQAEFLDKYATASVQSNSDSESDSLDEELDEFASEDDD